MDKIISIFALCLFSSMAVAGTELDCSADALETSDQVEACMKLADGELNKAYEQLKETRKDSTEQLDLLKKMQLGWIQMRDNQCELAMRNTGSNAALSGLLCELDLTERRATELSEL